MQNINKRLFLSLVFFPSTDLLQEQECSLSHLWGACMAAPRVGSDRWCWTSLARDWWRLIGRCLAVLSTHWSTADAAPPPGVFVGTCCIWPLTLSCWPAVEDSDWLVVGRLLLLLLLLFLVGWSVVVGGWMAVWRLELESSLSETLRPSL